MRAKHWLIGCALCIASIGSAAATSLDTQEQDSSSHAVTDNTGSHDGGNSNTSGDALGLTRDGTPHSSASSSTSSSSNDRTGGATTAPAPTRQPHLGWQSLLPGSIQ